MVVDTATIRDSWADDSSGREDGVGGACAAIARGDLRRAREVLGQIEPGSAEAVTVGYLVGFMTACWWPGTVGTMPVDNSAIPAAPPDTNSLVLTWMGQVLAQSMSMRVLATGALRAGPTQGTTIVEQLLLPRLLRWCQAAQNAGDEVAFVHALLLIADVAQRAGRFDLTAKHSPRPRSGVWTPRRWGHFGWRPATRCSRPCSRRRR
jgi:hypothetical protein